MVQAEFFLISELDHNLIIYHPFKSLKSFLQNSSMIFYSQSAVNIVNDSYFCDVILHYPPFLIALAAIYMTGIIEKQESKVKDWFDQLNVKMETVGEVLVEIIEMYENLKDLDSKIPSIFQKFEKLRREKHQ
jgi:hypothetical protein